MTIARTLSGMLRGRSGPRFSGAAALVAIGVLAWTLALALWLFWLPGEQRQLAALQDANAASRAAVVRRSADLAARPPKASPGERFVGAFPAIDSRPQRVESLLAAATSRKLAWLRMDLRVGRDTLPGLVRYQVTLPLAGDYSALRGLVDAALQADPALVLDRLQLRRSTATATLVEAASTWSLYTREEPVIAPGTDVRRSTPP